MFILLIKKFTIVRSKVVLVHVENYFNIILITDYHVSPERPPIVGYTGHIPGARSEVALSKRYAQAARKGLERVQREREERLNRAKDMHAVQRVLDNAYLDDTGHTRA